MAESAELTSLGELPYVAGMRESNGTPASHIATSGRFRLLGTLLALAAAAAVSQSFGRFTYSLLFAELRDGLRLSNTVAGALGSLNLLMYVTGSLVVALTVGRTGLSGAVRIGLAGNVIGLALLAWSPNLAVVAAALALTGFCAAGVWVGTPGIAAEIVAADRRGAAAGWLTGGVGCGMVAAAAIDAVLSGSGPNDLSVGTLAAADLSHPRSVYRIELVIGAAVMIAVVLALHSRQRPPDRSRTPGRVGFAGARTSLAKVPQAARLIAAYTLHAFVVTTLLTFIVSHLESHGDVFDARSAAVAFSSIGIGCIVGGPIFGRLADRLGRRRTVTVGFAVSATATVAMTASPPLAVGGPPLAWAAALVFGTAFTGIIASIAARVSDVLAGPDFGAAYGVATIVFGLGLAAGPPVGGAVADRFGSLGPVFGLVVVACIAGMLLSGWGDDPQPAEPSQLAAPN